MELEDDLKRLRFVEVPAGLRRRILNAAECAAPRSLLPPWLTAIERHWLYPGRRPALVLALAWLFIVSLRLTTPITLPNDGRVVLLTQQEIARFEYQRGQLLAALGDLQDSPTFPTRRPTLLPPRS